MSRCPELKVKWNIGVKHSTRYICFIALKKKYKNWNQPNLNRETTKKKKMCSK